MEIGSDSEDSFSKPTERKGKDNSTTLELLPPKSREVYENTYKRFMKWREDKKISSFSETVIIDYLADLSTTIKPTTLWGHYSMLKSTLNMKHGVNIKYYSNVIPYLKNKANGFLPTKSKTFTEDEINRFLTNAPDNKYLLTKVVLVFGVAGALRRDDLAEIRLEDIYDLGSVLVVKITKTKKPKTFTVTGDRNLTYYRKYIALRPVDMTETRLFIRYQNGMCLRQVVGVHKLTCTAQIVAAYLKLPDVKSYTGHCLRRTSAALLASEGADLKALRRQRSSESSTVTQSFKEESVTNKLEILENNLPPPKENIVISNEYTTISNVTNKIIKRNQPAGVPVLFSNCQNCTITLNVHHSK